MLQYQPRQVCRTNKVHKIRETNFVNLRHNFYDFKISEAVCEEIVKQRHHKRSLNCLDCHEILHAKRQGGGG
jgi:hypothetical protein